MKGDISPDARNAEFIRQQRGLEMDVVLSMLSIPDALSLAQPVEAEW